MLPSPQGGSLFNENNKLPLWGMGALKFIKIMKKISLPVAILASATAVAAEQQKPNIIMVMVDDMGFSDIQPYGGYEIETPNLTRLANEGTRFCQFYNNGISAPTRASLITGQYQHKAGLGFFNNNLGLAAYQGFLNKESLTFAEVLKRAGYTTLMSGKWHVGDDRDQWPNQRGFDHFFGFIGGASSYYEVDDNRNSVTSVRFIKDNEEYHLKDGEYLTDVITDNAIEFLDGQKNEKKPFFLYLAFNAPHWPLQAKKEDIAKYKGKFSIGWDSLRQVRLQNAIKQGVVPVSQQLAKHDDEIPLWRTLPYDEQKYWERRQEVYAAMIDRVDQEIGRVLRKLKQMKQDRNTLIIFISDNGAEGGRGAVSRSRGNYSVGDPGSYEVQNKYWSQTGNAPFREYKGICYEGGISAPLIAWFPGKIKKGRIVKGVGHLIDLAPTFYDLAGAEYPTEYNGVKTNALPGKSLLPILFGGKEEVEREKPLCWERAGNKAVRLGKWKYVSVKDGVDELYDIENDRSERFDVAAEHPDIVDKLKKHYTEWAEANDVVDFKLLRNPWGAADNRKNNVVNRKNGEVRTR